MKEEMRDDDKLFIKNYFKRFSSTSTKFTLIVNDFDNKPKLTMMINTNHKKRNIVKDWEFLKKEKKEIILEGWVQRNG